jgi:hypothetical protein
VVILNQKNFSNGLKLLLQDNMDNDKAEEYGIRNSSEGKLLIKIQTH